MAGYENIAGQGFHTNPERINKEGLNRGSRHMSTILREMLEEVVDAVDDVKGGEKTKKEVREVIIAKLIKKAMDGDLNAIKETFDRADGKSIQTTNVNATVNERQVFKIGDQEITFE